MNKINVKAYADDIVIICPSAIIVRRLFHELERQLVTKELMINFLKTRSMILTRKIDTFQGSVLHVNDTDNTNVKEYKYLGCMLGCKLK